MIEAAKDLIELGLPLIPICPHDHRGMSARHIERCKCPGKTPLIKGWQTWNQTTEADLVSWKGQFKYFNLGLPLGDASGFCGIDVDGDEGIRLLMEMSHGDLPGTWEFSTGAGSRLLYLIPEGMKTKKFKQTGEGAHQECALLCNGQQTVIPPSIHHTGRLYQWIDGHSPWDMDCAMAPDWLLEKIELQEPNYGFNMNLDLPSKNNKEEFDWDDEFESDMTEMQFDIPPEVKVSNKNVRTQGKTGHKIVVTEEMLTQPIAEGSRDNTMTAIVGHYCANRDLRRLGKEVILQICLKHNQDYCQPPLEDQAIIDKVEYFLNAEAMKDASMKKADKPQFEASTMAKNVLKHLENNGIYLHFDQYSKIYYYTTVDAGPWQSTRNYALISKWIREVMISPHYGHPTWDKRSYIEETRVALEEHFTMPYKKVDDFDLGAHSHELCDYIVVNNGMVDWRNNLLVDWDPSYKTTIAYDIEYDPYATCPMFEKYLKDWLPEESVRMVIQEYLGYCLIPNTNFRKAIFLYGRGKNGKSMLIEFLQEFFGDLNAGLSYDALFQRFGPANLKDKVVNIYDDTTVSFTKDTSIAKNLIAGGNISAEFKGKDHFQFQNIARFIYSSQETPKTADNSVAWFDRWFFIKFPNSFRPSNKIKTEIQNNLQREKQGIFNWMIAGLQRLMTNDDFSYSDTLAMYNVEYRSQNDNVTQFIHNLCTNSADPDDKLSITDLYKVYEIWAEAEHLRQVSKKVFTQRISDMGFDREKGYINGKSGQTYFKGLSLNKTSEDYIENQLEINVALNVR